MNISQPRKYLLRTTLISLYSSFFPISQFSLARDSFNLNYSICVILWLTRHFPSFGEAQTAVCGRRKCGHACWRRRVAWHSSPDINGVRSLFTTACSCNGSEGGGEAKMHRWERHYSSCDHSEQLIFDFKWNSMKNTIAHKSYAVQFGYKRHLLKDQPLIRAFLMKEFPTQYMLFFTRFKN